MADLSSHVGDVVILHMHVGGSLSANTADAAVAKVPFKGRILNVLASARAVTGSPTNVYLMVENGTTDILTGSGADVATAGTAAEGTLTAAGDAVAEDDVLHLDVTFNGGTSPTVADIGVDVAIARE